MAFSRIVNYDIKDADKASENRTEKRKGSKDGKKKKKTGMRC